MLLLCILRPSSKNAFGLLVLCMAKPLLLAMRLDMEAPEVMAPTPAVETVFGQSEGSQEVVWPSAATSLLSKGALSLRNAVLAEPIWFFCAGQFQECMCKGAVRWGVPGNWLEINQAKGDGWNRVKCSVEQLPDVAPGDATKHCQCGMPSDSASLHSINPALLAHTSEAALKSQPTISCETIKDSKGSGEWAASLYDATGAFCSDDWERQSSDAKAGTKAMSVDVMRSLMEAWVDQRFANNYKRLFDTSGWAPRAFVNYYAGVPDGKHTKMTEELINSVHAFSAEPIIVFHFGTQTPSEWNAERWPRLILFHAAPIPAEAGRSFNFNKMRAMLLARVRAGIVLDSDQFVAPGVDALFQRTEQEITKDYAMPIMPAHFLDRTPRDTGAYWARYCPTEDCRWQTTRWGHAHPTWTYWALPWVGRWLRRNFRDEVLPPLKDGAMQALRVTDVPEDEDLLNIATWEEGGTKQWCKFDLPGPGDFFQLLDACALGCSDISGDPRWHPAGVAKVFYTAHHAVDPEETKDWITDLKAKQQEGTLPSPILYHGNFFATGQEMKSKHPDARCII